jgi:phosphatidylglycerophosphatase A
MLKSFSLCLLLTPDDRSRSFGVHLNKLLDHLATGFQVGRMGRAPGTLGTLWGLPLAWLLSVIGPIPYIIGSVGITMGAIFVAEWYETQHEGHDRSEVVVDEIAGFVTGMALIPFTWKTALAGFVIFRFFDIVKPFPISYIDRKVRGGVGVVADDIVAGVFTNIILQILFYKINFFGVTN